MFEPEKSPRKGTNIIANSVVADWKKVSLVTPSSPAKGSVQFGLGPGETVGILKITLYDVKIQRKGSSGRDKNKNRIDSVYNQELSSSADNPLSFNYACRVKLGKRRVIPRKLMIPLSTKPTFLGSYLNFSVHSMDSQLEIEIIDLDTQYEFGTLRIPLKDVPFVHESIPFGPGAYYKWRPKRNSSIKGSLRLGLKLSKQKTSIRRVGEWRGKTAGGCLDHPTWINNPQYFLSVSLMTVLTFKLRSPLGKENYIGFYLIKVAEINELVAKRKAREEDVIKAGEHSQWMAKGSEDILKDIYIQPGSYIVLPCTKYPDVEGSFELTISGDFDTGIKLESFDSEIKSMIKGAGSDWLSSDDEDVSSGPGKTSSESESKDPGENNKKNEESVQKKRQANLMRAASIGNVNKLKHTIEKGGNASIKDKAGASALTLAARNGHFDCVKLLLTRGADANSMDSDGYNAVLMAAKGGHANTLKVLLEGGGDLKARDPKGNTALFLGAASGSLECVNELIERGASVNDTNNARQTPLMTAAEAGHAPIVQRLVKKGAKVNVKDTNGQTPLHFASSSGSLECVTFLIAQGADVIEKDHNGETALHKAALCGHVDILRLFIEKTDKDKSTNGITQAITSKRARNKKWETISLLMANEKEKGKKNGLLQQLRASVPATSSPRKKKILDVLVILNKHGERHSAYQLIAVDGMVLSSNLILEDIETTKDKGEKKKKSKKDSKTKKKDHKKKMSRSKDGDSEPSEEEDALVRVVAAGQLSVLCLLIERGKIPNSISTSSSLVYDIISPSEFDRLFMRCVDVLPVGEEGERDEDDKEKEKETKENGKEDEDEDSEAEHVKQLQLAMLNAPMGAFMTTLDSIEKVNLTIVNCTETQTPNVTDIHKTTELSTFAMTGKLTMVGMVVNTRYLPVLAATPRYPKTPSSPRASFEDALLLEPKKNRLFVWIKEGKNLIHPPSESGGGSSSSGGKEKKPLDAICEIKCGSGKFKTSVKKKESNPKWFERFTFELPEEDVGGEQVEIYVYDKDKPTDCLGKILVPVSLVRSKPIAKWYKLLPKKPGDKVCPGELSVEIHTAFVNVHK